MWCFGTTNKNRAKARLLACFFYWTMAAEKWADRTGRDGTGKPESSRRKERNRRIRRGKRAGRDAGKQGKRIGKINRDGIGKREKRQRGKGKIEKGELSRKKRGKAQGNRPMRINARGNTDGGERKEADAGKKK